MPPLDFDDTLGVSEAISAAGAPMAAAHYPRFPRLLAAIFTEARGAQDDGLHYSEQAAVGLADLQRRLGGTKDKDIRGQLEQQIADHRARTKRREAEFAERRAVAKAKAETDGRCIDSVHEYLKDTIGKGRRLRDVPLPIPVMLPEGLAATIEAKRAELIASGERRADVENRPARAVDLKEALSGAVAAEAKKARPPFDPRIRGGRDPINLARQLALGVVTGAGDAGTLIGKGGAPFLVWLFADQIEARLHAMVDEADLTGAMSDAQQADALAEVAAERLALEREEEALIRIGEAQGMTIVRRADADPRVVLMVEPR